MCFLCRDLVLTMTTMSTGISSHLPRVAYVMAIDVWMTTCLAFVFGALVEFSIVNVLARKADEKEHPIKKELDVEQLVLLEEVLLLNMHRPLLV